MHRVTTLKFFKGGVTYNLQLTTHDRGAKVNMLPFSLHPKVTAANTIVVHFGLDRTRQVIDLVLWTKRISLRLNVSVLFIIMLLCVVSFTILVFGGVLIALDFKHLLDVVDVD